MHYEKATVICPHCDYQYTADDFTSASVDLWALAPNEARTDLTCLSCNKEFVVQGGYTPHYTTAFAEEEL